MKKEKTILDSLIRFRVSSVNKAAFKKAAGNKKMSEWIIAILKKELGIS